VAEHAEVAGDAEMGGYLLEGRRAAVLLLIGGDEIVDLALTAGEGGHVGSFELPYGNYQPAACQDDPVASVLLDKTRPPH
jgi:hypothetical protein